MSADEMIPNSISQWDHQIPYYHQHQTSFQPVTSNMVQQPRINQTVLTQNTTSGPTIPTREVVSSSPSCVIGELTSPKNGVAKPARRRPRVSKKAPTTLLNASLTNFRSLVQQYTGCHSSSPILRNQRGPITLSFGPPAAAGSSGEQTWHHEQEQQQQQQLMVSYNNNSFLDNSPNNYSGFDKNKKNNNDSNNSSSKSSNPGTSMLTVDDYAEWP